MRTPRDAVDQVERFAEVRVRRLMFSMEHEAHRAMLPLFGEIRRAVT